MGQRCIEETYIFLMTGKPKYGCLKEDSIAFETSEITVPGKSGRFHKDSVIKWNRACSQIDHQGVYFCPEDSKILLFQMSSSQSLEKKYLREIREN